VILASLATACGTSGSTTTTTPKPTATCTRLPDGPPLVTPGERMAYHLQLQGLELATYDFGVGDATQVGGKPAIVVQGHAKAVGLVQMVAKIDDYSTSWIDVATGRPLRWATDEYATKGSDKERTDARFFERTGDTIPVDFHLNDAAPQPEPQKVTQQDIWDYNSFLIGLRTWDPACPELAFEVFRSRWMWHVDMKVRGRDKLVTQLGEFPAIRYDAHTYKVDRNDVRNPDSDARDFSVWISDDDGRVPLQNVAKTDYGDIKLEITDYQPGTGKRLRE
jgi:hypothetical protein